MTALFIILSALVLLGLGYKFYGAWLEKEWGVDPQRKTPAITKEDGVDYVAAKPVVLMGHHFSSIAGAGPINGPILASVFGWLPVFLWCVIGGIFFGGLQDFGSLFASIRHEGKSLGEIISDTMGKTAKRLFIAFALLVLILVIASFVNVVAGTFFTAGNKFGITSNPNGNQATAMISLLFIALAIGATVYLIWYSTKKRKEKMAERDRKKAEKAGQAPVNEAKKAPLTREEAEVEAERREQESLRKIRESRGQNPK